MPLETDSLLQDAVLWNYSGQTTANGQIKVKKACQIKVRWETTKRSMFDANGNTIALSADVMVDRDILNGSLMWLGRLKDLPNPVTNLHEVVAFDSTPDIKGIEVQRNVSLRKYGSGLPTIV